MLWYRSCKTIHLKKSLLSCYSGQQRNDWIPFMVENIWRASSLLHVLSQVCRLKCRDIIFFEPVGWPTGSIISSWNLQNPLVVPLSTRWEPVGHLRVPLSLLGTCRILNRFQYLLCIPFSELVPWKKLWGNHDIRSPE